VAVLVGTSGWHYADWKEAVYPSGLPSGQWLAFLAREMATVELNNSFYRLPDRARFAAWADQVPDRFVFAVKASRYLTHIRSLRDPAQPVARLLDRAEGLGKNCGPFLLQLPPDFRADAGALDETLTAFGTTRRVAVEMRHPSWQADEVRQVLESHNSACCWTDRRGRQEPRWRTADWGYVRFHEGTAAPRPCYGDAALKSAAREILAVFDRYEDVYVYFNNDQGACAVRNARRLVRMVLP
jgi:uncharacterized protein YecE (DUF72 family)